MGRRMIRALAFGATSLAVAGLLLFRGVAAGSNMGFKLNFGVLRALDSLLAGSGIAFSWTPEAELAEGTLALSLDLAHGPFSQSNMGFKLNVRSVPAGGLLVEEPNGDLLLVQPDDAGHLTFAPLLP